MGWADPPSPSPTPFSSSSKLRGWSDDVDNAYDPVPPPAPNSGNGQAYSRSNGNSGWGGGWTGGGNGAENDKVSNAGSRGSKGSRLSRGGGGGWGGASLTGGGGGGNGGGGGWGGKSNAAGPASTSGGRNSNDGGRSTSGSGWGDGDDAGSGTGTGEIGGGGGDDDWGGGPSSSNNNGTGNVFRDHSPKTNTNPSHSGSSNFRSDKIHPSRANAGAVIGAYPAYSNPNAPQSKYGNPNAYGTGSAFNGTGGGGGRNNPNAIGLGVGVGVGVGGRSVGGVGSGVGGSPSTGTGGLPNANGNGNSNPNPNPGWGMRGGRASSFNQPHNHHQPQYQHQHQCQFGGPPSDSHWRGGPPHSQSHSHSHSHPVPSGGGGVGHHPPANANTNTHGPANVHTNANVNGNGNSNGEGGKFDRRSWHQRAEADGEPLSGAVGGGSGGGGDGGWGGGSEESGGKVEDDSGWGGVGVGVGVDGKKDTGAVAESGWGGAGEPAPTGNHTHLNHQNTVDTPTPSPKMSVPVPAQTSTDGWESAPTEEAVLPLDRSQHQGQSQGHSQDQYQDRDRRSLAPSPSQSVIAPPTITNAHHNSRSHSHSHSHSHSGTNSTITLPTNRFNGWGDGPSVPPSLVPNRDRDREHDDSRTDVSVTPSQSLSQVEERQREAYGRMRAERKRREREDGGRGVDSHGGEAESVGVERQQGGDDGWAGVREDRRESCGGGGGWGGEVERDRNKTPTPYDPGVPPSGHRDIPHRSDITSNDDDWNPEPVLPAPRDEAAAISDEPKEPAPTSTSVTQNEITTPPPAPQSSSSKEDDGWATSSILDAPNIDGVRQGAISPTGNHLRWTPVNGIEAIQDSAAINAAGWSAPDYEHDTALYSSTGYNGIPGLNRRSTPIVRELIDPLKQAQHEDETQKKLDELPADEKPAFVQAREKDAGGWGGNDAQPVTQPETSTVSNTNSGWSGAGLVGTASSGQNAEAPAGVEYYSTVPNGNQGYYLQAFGTGTEARARLMNASKAVPGYEGVPLSHNGINPFGRDSDSGWKGKHYLGFHGSAPETSWRGGGQLGGPSYRDAPPPVPVKDDGWETVAEDGTLSVAVYREDECWTEKPQASSFARVNSSDTLTPRSPPHRSEKPQANPNRLTPVQRAAAAAAAATSPPKGDADKQKRVEHKQERSEYVTDWTKLQELERKMDGRRWEDVNSTMTSFQGTPVKNSDAGSHVPLTPLSARSDLSHEAKSAIDESREKSEAEIAGAVDKEDGSGWSHFQTKNLATSESQPSASGMTSVNDIWSTIVVADKPSSPDEQRTPTAMTSVNELWTAALKESRSPDPVVLKAQPSLAKAVSSSIPKPALNVPKGSLKLTVETSPSRKVIVRLPSPQPSPRSATFALAPTGTPKQATSTLQTSSQGTLPENPTSGRVVSIPSASLPPASVAAPPPVESAVNLLLVSSSVPITAVDLKGHAKANVVDTPSNADQIPAPSAGSELPLAESSTAEPPAVNREQIHDAVLVKRDLEAGESLELDSAPDVSSNPVQSELKTTPKALVATVAPPSAPESDPTPASPAAPINGASAPAKEAVKQSPRKSSPSLGAYPTESVIIPLDDMSDDDGDENRDSRRRKSARADAPRQNETNGTAGAPLAKLIGEIQVNPLIVKSTPASQQESAKPQAVQRISTAVTAEVTAPYYASVMSDPLAQTVYKQDRKCQMPVRPSYPNNLPPNNLPPNNLPPNNLPRRDSMSGYFKQNFEARIESTLFNLMQKMESTTTNQLQKHNILAQLRDAETQLFSAQSSIAQKSVQVDHYQAMIGEHARGRQALEGTVAAKTAEIEELKARLIQVDAMLMTSQTFAMELQSKLNSSYSLNTANQANQAEIARLNGMMQQLTARIQTVTHDAESSQIALQTPPDTAKEIASLREKCLGYELREARTTLAKVEKERDHYVQLAKRFYAIMQQHKIPDTITYTDIDPITGTHTQTTTNTAYRQALPVRTIENGQQYGRSRSVSQVQEYFQPGSRTNMAVSGSSSTIVGSENGTAHYRATSIQPGQHIKMM